MGTQTEAVLTCTHNQYFEQKLEKKIKIYSVKIFFLQPKISLHIAWACFRNKKLFHVIRWRLSGFKMVFVVERF